MGYSPQDHKKSDTTEQLHFTSPTPVFLGFPCGSAGKESTCSAGDLGSIPGLGRSLRGGHGNPLQYSRLESLQGQRSLVGCSLWGLQESDTTEQLSTAQHSTPQAGHRGRAE